MNQIVLISPKPPIIHANFLQKPVLIQFEPLNVHTSNIFPLLIRSSKRDVFLCISLNARFTTWFWNWNFQFISVLIQIFWTNFTSSRKISYWTIEFKPFSLQSTFVQKIKTHFTINWQNPSCHLTIYHIWNRWRHFFNESKALKYVFLRMNGT